MASIETDQRAAGNGSLFKGASLVVFCMAVLGVSDNFVRYVGAEIGLWQFHFMRSIVICSAVFMIAKMAGWNTRSVSKRNVAIRTFLYGMSMMLYFAAIGFIPVAKAAAGLFTAPIFMLIFTVFLFGGRIGPWRIAAVCIGFAGVLMVLRPFSDALDPMSVVSILAGVFYALGLLFTREYCADEPTAAVVLWFFTALGLAGLVGVVLNTWIMPVAGEGSFLTIPWAWPSSTILWVLLAISFAAMIAMSSQTKGYQIADASLLSVFEYSFLVFSGLWGWILWGEVFSPMDLWGMGLIAVSGVIIGLRHSQ